MGILPARAATNATSPKAHKAHTQGGTRSPTESTRRLQCRIWYLCWNLTKVIDAEILMGKPAPAYVLSLPGRAIELLRPADDGDYVK
jgi:hypothetical protein